VRAQGRDVHLHIIGTSDNPSYYQRIRQRVQENSSWIFLNENLSREELARLVAQHRYGIHGMAEEHFGMAVAEMVRAGCVVFVPRGGGQKEIVAGEERLLYQTPAEAVTKIARTLSDAGEQASLRDYLATRKDLFSPELFVRRIQDIVQQFP
jgi:glycosyltransferase involved in cell wall biosynthesis